MIGCDIIEIERVSASINKLGQNFICAILSSREIELYNKRGSRVEFVAGRFAAKEAISKALGTGIGRGLSFTDIEILSNDLGKPEVYIKEEKANHIEVSISHSRKDAMAVCMIKEVL